MSEFILGLVVLGVMYFFFRAVGKLLFGVGAKVAQLLRRDRIEGYTLPPAGEYNVNVVGESFHFNALEELAGNHGSDSAHVRCSAKLILEDNNEKDANAVRVELSGKTVGHLRREDAAMMRRMVKRLHLPVNNLTCSAIIVGGFIKRDREKADYGVKLDFDLR